MGFIFANRTQGRLFGYSLEEFVSPKAKARHIVAWTGRLDLIELYSDYSPQGGDAYDPRILLSTWFFAYSEGITSTRKLETLCKRDMHFIYVSANLQPDHTSLSRFRKRHAARLPDLFVQIVRLAAADGVGDFGRIAIDGTKIEARASSRQNRTSEKLSEELQSVRRRIAEYLQDCELLDETDGSESVEEVQRRIEQLRALEQKLLARQEAVEARKATLQAKDRAKHRINLTDPEARNMNAINGKPAAPGFNAQLGVDTNTGMIVGEDVTDAPTDQQQFSRQHRKIEDNLPQNPQRTYVADAGYNSLEQLEYIEEAQVDAVLADPRPEHRDGGGPASGNRYTRSAFRYDSESDSYSCPGGHELTHWYTDHYKCHPQRVYRCRACGECLHRTRCLAPNAKRVQRTVWRDVREPLAEAMAAKSRTERGKCELAIRSQTVEPAIGNLKSNLGFRRFCLHGLLGVRAEFALMCIAHNLNRLFRLITGTSDSYSRPFWLAYCLWGSLTAPWSAEMRRWRLPARNAA